MAVPFFLISWGEQRIDSTVATFVFATVPLFTIFSAHSLLPDDQITLPKVLGLLLGFVGAIAWMGKDLTSASIKFLARTDCCPSDICFLRREFSICAQSDR